MTNLGSVLTRVKQKFFVGENGKPVKVGKPVVDQIRYEESPSKAACEVPGLTGEQVYWLKQEGFITVQEKNEMVFYELVTADEYQEKYNEDIKARDAK